MNNVSLIGRLTKNPELRETQNGVPVCNFTLAVDRRFKSEGQPTADFINITTWNKTAEFAHRWFSKGLRVGVTGRIQTRSWEDADGVRHYATDVVADSLDFADGKREDEFQNVANEKDYDSYSEDDLPF